MHEMVLWRLIKPAFGRESEGGSWVAADRVIGARLSPSKFPYSQFSS